MTKSSFCSIFKIQFFLRSCIFQWMNFNMWCIETVLPESFVWIALKMNFNMWCIETQLGNTIYQQYNPDELQHVMYWNFTVNIISLILHFRWTSTCDVLKRYFFYPATTSVDLMNFNMWCIETDYPLLLALCLASMNFNMWCIETSLLIYF